VWWQLDREIGINGTAGGKAQRLGRSVWKSKRESSGASQADKIKGLLLKKIKGLLLKKIKGLQLKK
jgi:hypothetical protein